jgi:hypothetical protein
MAVTLTCSNTGLEYVIAVCANTVLNGCSDDNFRAFIVCYGNRIYSSLKKQQVVAYLQGVVN